MWSTAVKWYPRRAIINPAWSSLSLEQFVQVLFGDGEQGTAGRVGALRVAWQVSRRKFSRFGILSLTESPDNLVLWAHYAGGASGLCIGFDESSAVFQHSRHADAGLEGIHKVRYSITRATFGADPNEKHLGEIVLTKSIDWQYERELRCIRELAEGEEYIFPSFEVKDVVEIILGPNMPIDLIQRCIDIQERKFPNATLLLALPDPDHYKMIFFECPRGTYLESTLRDFVRDIRPLSL